MISIALPRIKFPARSAMKPLRAEDMISVNVPSENVQDCFKAIHQARLGARIWDVFKWSRGLQLSALLILAPLILITLTFAIYGFVHLRRQRRKQLTDFDKFLDQSAAKDVKIKELKEQILQQQRRLYDLTTRPPVERSPPAIGCQGCDKGVNIAKERRDWEFERNTLNRELNRIEEETYRIGLKNGQVEGAVQVRRVEKETAASKAQYEKDIAELKDLHIKEIDHLQASHISEIMMTKHAHDAETTSLKTTHVAEVDTIKRNLNNERMTQVRRITRDHQVEINDFHEEAQATINQKQTKVDKEIESRKKLVGEWQRFERKAYALEEELNAKIAMQQGIIDKSSKTRQHKQLEWDHGQMKISNQHALNLKDVKIAGLRNEHTQLEAALEKSGRKIENLKDEIENLRGTNERNAAAERVARRLHDEDRAKWQGEKRLHETALRQAKGNGEKKTDAEESSEVIAKVVKDLKTCHQKDLAAVKADLATAKKDLGDANARITAMQALGPSNLQSINDAVTLKTENDRLWAECEGLLLWKSQNLLNKDKIIAEHNREVNKAIDEERQRFVYEKEQFLKEARREYTEQEKHMRTTCESQLLSERNAHNDGKKKLQGQIKQADFQLRYLQSSADAATAAEKKLKAERDQLNVDLGNYKAVVESLSAQFVEQSSKAEKLSTELEETMKLLTRQNGEVKRLTFANAKLRRLVPGGPPVAETLSEFEWKDKAVGWEELHALLEDQSEADIDALKKKLEEMKEINRKLTQENKDLHALLDPWTT